MRKNRCRERTRAGRRCLRTACSGNGCCHVHLNDIHLNDICSLCLEHLDHPGACLKLSKTCNHNYHKVCLQSWLVRNRRSCPNCRETIVFKDHQKAFPKREVFMAHVHYVVATLQDACIRHRTNIASLTAMEEDQIVSNMEMIRKTRSPEEAQQLLLRWKKTILGFIETWDRT